MPGYNIDERQQAVRDFVKELAEREVLPVAQELDRRPEPQEFPLEYYRKLARAGCIGFTFPKKYGGLEKSMIEYATMVEELCYYDPPSCLLAAVAVLATEPIDWFASEEQKDKYLRRIMTGEIVPAFALTEPEAGSDAAAQTTEFRVDGDDFVVNGTKHFIMHGDAADLILLFGKVSEDGSREKISTLLVEGKKPGIKQEGLRYKMGMRAATTGRITFTDYRVPRSTMVGERNKGFRYAMQTLDSARVGVAAQGVGIAQRALDESVAYAKKRQAFGAPIAKLQAIQWMIADMSTRTEAARLLCYKSAQMKDRGEKFGLAASHAKLYCTETAGFCVDRAMQIHAGYGYIGEFSTIEKLYRDQRVLEIYEGTSEVQRLVIANNLLR